MVSICTVTYNRPLAVKLLEKRILEQTYPTECMEWVLIDDSPSDIPDFEPAPGSNLKINYVRLPNKLTLGRKRNLSNNHCKGDIIVYMDDDDYYPPTRVEHAVQELTKSACLIAGCSILPILFIPENELWVSGPFNKNHATANTFAFKRELLSLTQFEDEATHAEERKFLKDYSIEMVQLEPKHTIICIGHDRNTFEKRQLIQGGNNPRFKRLTELNQKQLALIESISSSSLQASKPLAKQISPEGQPASSTKNSQTLINIIIRSSLRDESILQCVNSLREQDYAYFHAVIVTSENNQLAHDRLQMALEGDSRFRILALPSPEQSSSYLEDFIRGIRLLKPTGNEVLIVIEERMLLSNARSLASLAQIYREEKCLLTYGESQVLSPAQKLFTLKAELLNSVNSKELHDSEGKLLTDSGEISLIKQLIKLAGSRITYIDPDLLISYKQINTLAIKQCTAHHDKTPALHSTLPSGTAWNLLGLKSFHCISLAASSDRRRLINEQAQKTGLQPIFFDAITPTNLPRFKTDTSVLNRPTELACLASHLMLIKSIADNADDPDDEKVYLITEDDVVLREEFDADYFAVSQPPEWDIIQLGTSNPGSLHRLISLRDHKDISYVRWEHNFWGAFAYIIKRHAIKRIAKYLFSEAEEIHVRPWGRPDRFVADFLLFESVVTYTSCDPLASFNSSFDTKIGHPDSVVNATIRAASIITEDWTKIDRHSPSCVVPPGCSADK